MIFRCFGCKKNHKKKFNKDLTKRFKSIFKFCKGDIKKFFLIKKTCLSLMDSWGKLDETSLHNKKTFYSSLNVEDITDVDYRHANNAFKKIKLKNLGQYHDLYVQSDTLLLANVFENFRNMRIKV